MDVLCTFKFKIESKNLDHQCIKDKWTYPNQGQDAKPKAGSSNILQRPKSGHKGHGCSLHLQNQDWEPKFGIQVYQIKIKMPNPCQKPPVSSKAPFEDLKDMDVFYTFKIKIESQNLDHMCIKYQWPYQNQDQVAKSQSVTSSILLIPKSGQNQTPVRNL